MITHTYSYESTLADSLKVDWKVSDLIGPDKPLDFSKPFLPESLAGVRELSSLSDREKLLLNQIRGYGYTHMFQVAEEFVVPSMIETARSMMPCGDAVAVQTLLTFAEEEAKHIHMFQCFGKEFNAGFHTPCALVGPLSDLANALLKFGPIGRTLLAFHLEWVTLSHYIDSVKDDQSLDPQFKNLLRHHWMEESQHAKTNTLLLEKFAREGGPDAVAQGLADFAAMGGMFDGLLQQQVQFDLDALEAASGRKLGASERADIGAAQLRSQRYTFLVSGLIHKNFLGTVGQLGPGVADQMREMARQLSN